MSNSVSIIGGGAWGVALAAAAARAGASSLLYTRRTTNGALPDGVKTTASLAEAAKHARLLVLAVPSGAAAEVARELGDHTGGAHYVVHGVRGLSGEALETISEVVRKETPVRRVGALGGPALSDDLLHGRPSVIVCGSLFPEVTESFTQGFGSPTLRVYPTNDLVGLEWASALVGGLTIAVGFAQGIGMSAGLVAAFISRSVGEASRIAAAAGGEEKTLLGLAGYGDLLASTSQMERPEVILGRELAKGTKLADAMGAAKLRVEAIELVPRVVAFAERHKVRAPIFKALGEGILGGKGAEALLKDLMSQPIAESA